VRTSSLATLLLVLLLLVYLKTLRMRLMLLTSVTRDMIISCKLVKTWGEAAMAYFEARSASFARRT
jgi:hypothetical protein